MPSEDRIITFDYPETYQAIYSLCAQKKIKKPAPGMLEDVYQNKDDTFRIFMDIKHRTEGTTTKEEYSRDFFAAALMLYCRGCGIPLPKNATKSVSIKGKDVILRVQI